jgi:hypothetical protein
MKTYFIKSGSYVYEPPGWAKSFGFIECVLRSKNLDFKNVIFTLKM